MSLVLASEPTSLVAVNDQCAAVEAWAEQCDSAAEVRDAINKLAAIDEYLKRTSTEGRERVAATMRRLEVRVGKLLGKAKRGGDRRAEQVPREELALSKKERHVFRQMAEHEDTVEKVISESTEASPASRRKVTQAITKPRRGPLADTAKSAGWELRKAVERVERVIADDRFAGQKEQVATQLRGHLSYAQEVCQDLLHKLT